ncbi:MAG: hypothetical protein HQK96_12560 [Nitrospirae bacterium]|nr:hypothetical protein [Nitrospirota bacterium]
MLTIKFKESMIANSNLWPIMITLAATCVLFVLLYPPPYNVPFEYYGDGLFTEWGIKTILDNGWYLHNSFTGSPFGTEFYDFPDTEPLNLLIIKVSGLFIGNCFLIFNLLFAFGFISTTISALLVMIRLKVKPFMAIAGSVVYTFLPYHYERLGHLGLSIYFAIPILIYIAIRIDTDIPPFFSKEGKVQLRQIGVIIASMIAASTGVYYAFFGIYIILVSGSVSSLRRRCFKPLLSAFIITAIIGGVVLINLTPSILYQHDNGPNNRVARRSFVESEIYGLRITQLLLPTPNHFIKKLAHITNVYDQTAPLVNENMTVTLGIIGSIGFIVLLIAMFVREKGLLADALFKTLAEFNLALLLYATIGGFGTLFSMFISPEIRCLNRISVFIAFLSILATLLVIQKIVENTGNNTGKHKFIFISICLLVIGIFDQLPQLSLSNMHNYFSARNSIVKEFRDDSAFVNTIEGAVPKGTMIYQLPYIEFPESPPMNKARDYDMFRGYVHSKTLLWSYGAMKGRHASKWFDVLSKMPIEEQLDIVRRSGFGGIYINRLAFDDNGLLESKLKTLLNREPIVNNRGDLAFYKIEPAGLYPVYIAIAPELGRGFSGWEGNSVWSTGKNAEMYLFNDVKEIQNMQLSFTLDTLRPRSLHIRTKDALLLQSALVPGNVQEIRLNLKLLPGQTVHYKVEGIIRQTKHM